MGKNLGRGISAFLNDDTNDHGPVNVTAVENILPNPFQPRKIFDEEALQSLSESIREKGIIQPVVVREKENGLFELIAGERRFKAAKLAGLTEIPIIISNMSDTESLEIAILENIQREDLNPLEEGEAYKRLMTEFSKTQEDIAKMTGKSRSHIANILRLLALPVSIKDALIANKITAGHAKVLVNTELSEQLLHKILNEELNVRQTEKLVNYIKNGGVLDDYGITDVESYQIQKPKLTKTAKEQTYFKKPINSAEDYYSFSRDDEPVLEKDALSEQLSGLLNTDVQIRFNGAEGAMVIYFESIEELDRILKQITNSSI